MIVVGLDGGMNGGAAVALAKTGDPLGFETWASRSSTNKHLMVATAAKRLRMQLPGTEVIALACETVYVQVHRWKVNEVRVAKQIASRGYAEVKGSPGYSSISIAKSVGIFIGYFPEWVFDVAPTEWRKMVGIKNEATSDLKGMAIAVAVEELLKWVGPVAEHMRVCITSGNDHLAEAYHIARAGHQIIHHKEQ